MGEWRRVTPPRMTQQNRRTESLSVRRTLKHWIGRSASAETRCHRTAVTQDFGPKSQTAVSHRRERAVGSTEDERDYGSGERWPGHGSSSPTCRCKHRWTGSTGPAQNPSVGLGWETLFAYSSIAFSMRRRAWTSPAGGGGGRASPSDIAARLLRPEGSISKVRCWRLGVAATEFGSAVPGLRPSPGTRARKPRPGVRVLRCGC